MPLGDHGLVDALVWVESWQQQCCGDGFGTGTSIQWQVRRNGDTDDWVELLLGAQWANRIGFIEDHHTADAGGMLTGVVSEIDVVTCDRVLGPKGTDLVPVPGSGRIRRVEVADDWEPEPPGTDAGWSFDGWIVKVVDAQYAAGSEGDHSYS